MTQEELLTRLLAENKELSPEQAAAIRTALHTAPAENTRSVTLEQPLGEGVKGRHQSLRNILTWEPVKMAKGLMQASGLVALVTAPLVAAKVAGVFGGVFLFLYEAGSRDLSRAEAELLLAAVKNLPEGATRVPKVKIEEHYRALFGKEPDGEVLGKAYVKLHEAKVLDNSGAEVRLLERVRIDQ